MIKDKWLAALRSGDYKQGVGYLKDGDSYCCLGVLCDISGLGEWAREGDGRDVFLFDGYHALSQLPPGLFDISISDQGRLMHLNDSKGKTFDEIADWIEENL